MADYAFGSNPPYELRAVACERQNQNAEMRARNAWSV